jgi:hypothetical protein
MVNSTTKTQMHGYYNFSTKMVAVHATRKILDGATILREEIILKHLNSDSLSNLLFKTADNQNDKMKPMRP